MVRCSEWENCPFEDCYHWKEHQPYIELVHIGGKGDSEPQPCDKVSRTCGFRDPWVEVKCLPIEPIKGGQHEVYKLEPLEV